MAFGLVTQAWFPCRDKEPFQLAIGGFMYKEKCNICYGTGKRSKITSVRWTDAHTYRDCTKCNTTGFVEYKLSPEVRNYFKMLQRKRTCEKKKKYRIPEKPEKEYDPYDYDIS